ncbi:MAG TPA: bifunctional demethylmenaquinone methyltransferase/2-methoxy-6-polyprenyl-1,4-benzoquinol methylase UbiE [Vicinamibacterales bacterium]|nr:bifunctional demethylmenaquinone methyltransferase/2-methoxy-6-polyprenyl-1,4-benzoquinol methylase UbiE [Vicinamibacterales bacterium]
MDLDDQLRAKDPARIAGMFDAIASRYDFLNHLLSAGIDRYWRARAIRTLRLTGRETLLDLCTGTADLAMAAAAPGRAARVVGIDFAGAMLDIGHEKVARSGLSRAVRLVRGDAMALPLADRSVDAVTIAFGIRNVADPLAACRDIRRVLRPGGRLAILEFGLPPGRVVRAFYLWYFRHVLPRIGRLVSRHSSAYTYLPASVGSFPPPATFAGLLTTAGFTQVEANPLTFGIVYLYQATVSA